MICPQCSFPNTADQQFCGHCGAHLTQTTTGYDALARLGEVLNGRYRLIRMIGMGASGAVYRAEIEGLGQTVAVKILHPHISADLQARRRLENEAKLASLIDHPNIVSIIDLHSSPELTYLVMEHLSGVSLDEVLAEVGHLGVRRAIHIVRQLLSALETSHRHGVLHRDLKPDNIYLTLRHDRLDFVKVVDFGLATLTHRTQDSRITVEGHVCGTPGYMSPEQVRNMELSERSDLYAVGVILYECLTGINPFIGKSTVDTMVNQVTLMPKPPSALCKSAKIPLYLDALVMRALAKNAEERFASAREFRQVVEGLVLAQAGGEESTRRTCPECGNALPAGATRCSTCGHRATAEPAPPVITVAPSPEAVSPEENIDPRELDLAPTTTTTAYRAVVWDPPLAGRSEELKRITALFDERAAPCPARFLRIVAGAGLGKGRLVREAARLANKLRWQVVWVGQELQPVAAALSPIRRAARLLLRVPEGLSNPGELLQLASQAGFEMAHQQGLLELLGLREDPGTSVTERRRRWALAWHEAVRCVARRERLLLIFQDLHLVDQPSQELVASLVSKEPHAHAVNVLVTHDPQLLLLWAETEMMSLSPLSATEAQTLAGELLGRMDLQTNFEPIVAASGGNPLLLIELVRLVAIDPSIRLPRTLPEVISQRISRLPVKPRMLLHHIAVLGRPAQPPSLLPMLEEESGEEESGDELRALTFLGEQGFLVSGPHGWHISHRLHREVAYTLIPIALRQQLHAKAAQQGIEKHWSATSIAHHLCESGASPQAIPYLLRAGQQALYCLDDHLAGELFNRVLRLIPAPPHEIDGERKPWLDAVLGLASAMRDGGDRPEALRVLKQAITIAHKAGWLAERQACEQLLGALRQQEQNPS